MAPVPTDVPAPRLQLDPSEEDGNHVLVLSGEVDLHTVPSLEDAIGRTPDDADLVLDLAGVTFLDSVGLRVMVSAHERISAAGGSLSVRRPSDAARRVLEITGLDEHFDLTE